MRPFVYQLAESPDAVRAAFQDASAVAATEAPVQFLAGGTTILDLMKLDVMRPQRLIDINPLQRSALGAIESDGKRLRLGALVRMNEAAEHPTIRRDYPVIAQTLQLAASQQLRNMASLAGNALQRTRCNYFRDVSYTECNKRKPGSGCAALDGYNRRHAVLGVSEHCIATYPGDFAQALIALDASVELVGPNGRRSLRFAELHRQPGDRPEVETTLAPGEMIARFLISSGPWPRSLYLKVRDRESYEFAAASAAVALALDGPSVREVRIGLGGVATVPWRAHEAEAALHGKTINEDSARAAAEAAFAAAKPAGGNAFKVELGKRTLARTLIAAAQMEI
jgi:xanthine dehydrogenase YagS FAD-binding subunit